MHPSHFFTAYYVITTSLRLRIDRPTDRHSQTDQQTDKEMGGGNYVLIEYIIKESYFLRSAIYNETVDYRRYRLPFVFCYI